MNLRAKIAVVAASVFLAGCREMPGYFASDTTLARAGGSELKMRDVESVVPKGVTGEDSAAFMKVYIDRWVRKQLKLQEAEILFSASADDIDKMVEEIGKPKFEYEHASFDEVLFEKLVNNEFESMEYCMDTPDKNVREARVNDWITMVEEKYGEEHPDMMNYMDEILYKLQKKVVKKWLLAGKRVDGRAMNEILSLIHISEPTRPY